MKTDIISSNILNKKIEYKIVSQPDLEDEVYLLYVQDGKDYLEIGNIEKVYDELIQTFPSLSRKLVMVLIHPGDSLERWNSYHHQGRLFLDYIHFMYDELIQLVEHQLPTISRRGLLGDSLAANISLHIAAKEPESWTHLLLQSAATSFQGLTDLASMKKRYPWKVYQTVGLKEDAFISPITNEKLYILSRNRQLQDVLASKGADVCYREQDESHEWVFWKKDLQEALRFFIDKGASFH